MLFSSTESNSCRAAATQRCFSSYGSLFISFHDLGSLIELGQFVTSMKSRVPYENIFGGAPLFYCLNYLLESVEV